MPAGRGVIPCSALPAPVCVFGGLGAWPVEQLERVGSKRARARRACRVERTGRTTDIRMGLSHPLEYEAFGGAKRPKKAQGTLHRALR